LLLNRNIGSTGECRRQSGSQGPEAIRHAPRPCGLSDPARRCAPVAGDCAVIRLHATNAFMARPAIRPPSDNRSMVTQLDRWDRRATLHLAWYRQARRAYEVPAAVPANFDRFYKRLAAVGAMAGNRPFSCFFSERYESWRPYERSTLISDRTGFERWSGDVAQPNTRPRW